MIVGLIDSFSIGDSNDKSMEDPAGEAADSNGVDGDKADGDREGRNAKFIQEERVLPTMI